MTAIKSKQLIDQLSAIVNARAEVMASATKDGSKELRRMKEVTVVISRRSIPTKSYEDIVAFVHNSQTLLPARYQAIDLPRKNKNKKRSCCEKCNLRNVKAVKPIDSFVQELLVARCILIGSE